jgi:predicted dehydrogenase
MKFLVDGFGSIGQRHVSNLIKLGYRDIIIISRKKKINKKFSKIKVFKNLSEGLKLNPNIALICNPTSLHDKSMIACAKANCHLFVEKPVSSNTRNEKKIENLIKKKKLTNMVGYMMRFHPAINKIEQLLKKNIIGKIFNIQSMWGEYLPNWHPKENYKKSYASQKKLGGGVSLTLSHDLDLLKKLFGIPQKIYKLDSNDSNLKLKVDTYSNFLVEFKKNIFASIHLNYLMQKPQRYIRIIGENGEINFNYYKNIVSLIKNKSQKTYEFKNFERNELFLKEINYFIKCVKNNLNAEPSIKCSFNLIREFKINN